MPSGRIVILNGCSSAGKSSLATALQRAATDLQFLHVSLDAFRAMEPPGYFSEERRTQWPSRMNALCHAINGTARTFATQGQNVLVDHVLSPDAWAHVLKDLRTEDVLFVKVTCKLADAEARERHRGDRPLGLARSQWESVHNGREYDYEINTSEHQAADAANLVGSWFRSHPLAAAMQAMGRPKSAASQETPDN